MVCYSQSLVVFPSPLELSSRWFKKGLLRTTQAAASLVNSLLGQYFRFSTSRWPHSFQFSCLIPFNFRLSSIFLQFSTLLWPFCDVVLPYLGIKGKKGSKFNFCRFIWDRNRKVLILIHYQINTNNKFHGTNPTNIVRNCCQTFKNF